MKPQFIVWHCSATPYGTADLIRAWHQARGWQTLGYHGCVLSGVLTQEDFVKGRKVDWLDGAFQVGRTFDADADLEKMEVGAHAYGINRESLGLCLIGSAGTFTVRQIRSAIEVTQHWMRQFDISFAGVIGHYEIGLHRPKFATNKVCPGIDMNEIRDLIALNQHTGDMHDEFNAGVLELAKIKM